MLHFFNVFTSRILDLDEKERVGKKFLENCYKIYNYIY